MIETKEIQPVPVSRTEWFCAVDNCRCDGKCRKKNTVDGVGCTCKERITWEQANPRLVPKAKELPFRHRERD